jgi:Kef-type K+ transport system membrane component KefB
VNAVNTIGLIAPHAMLLFLLQVGLLLLLALVLGRLAARFGLPVVVGELAVGVLLGPSLLGHMAPDLSTWLLPRVTEQVHLLDALGQVGVLLLVGITGAHMDLGLVRRRGATAASVSVAGLAVPLGLGIGAGYLMPRSLLAATADRTVFALFLAVAMCVSAIPVIAKTLIDMNLLQRNIGQLILTAATIDDAFGWLMLSVVSAMATTGVRMTRISLSILSLVVVVTVALTVGRPLVRAVLRATSRSEDAGPTIAAAVVIVLLGAAATHWLGLEAVFGAFVCGILIGSCGGLPRERLAPLRTVVLSVLAPLFFATAGLRMDLTALGNPTVLVAALVMILIAVVGKFAGAFLGARLSRLNRWEALALGAGLNARGIIEVIVAMVGLRLGVLSVEVYTIVILVAIVTSLMAPPILRIAMARVEHTAEERLREDTVMGAPPRAVR